MLLVPPLIADMKLASRGGSGAAFHGDGAARAERRAGDAAPGFAAWLTSLVPVNVVKAAADGAMLPLIVFTFLFALGGATHRAGVTERAGRVLRCARRRDDDDRRLDHRSWRRSAFSRWFVVAASRIGRRSRGRDGVLHPRHLGGAGAVCAADVSDCDGVRPHSASGGSRAGAARTGGGAQLELVVGVVAGARRRRQGARNVDADHRVRLAAVGLGVQGGNADHVADWDAVSRRSSMALLEHDERW